VGRDAHSKSWEISGWGVLEIPARRRVGALEMFLLWTSSTLVNFGVQQAYSAPLWIPALDIQADLSTALPVFRTSMPADRHGYGQMK
jgi:hypothetical protein